MENNHNHEADNFRPLDNSVRNSLRYQIEAEKQLEAYSNAYNRRNTGGLGNSMMLSFIGSLFKGIYFLITGLFYLLTKK